MLWICYYFGTRLVLGKREYQKYQCVEHVVAQRIAILRVQKPEDAPFLPSENRFS